MAEQLMDHCCYDCPVANCTVRELLRYISNRCDNGAGTVTAAAVLNPITFFGFVVPFIIIAFLFCLLVYKKRCGHQSDTRSRSSGRSRVGIRRNPYHNKRNQSNESHIDGRSNQENGENNESSGAEGIIYDVVNNEPHVTTAPEMKQNQAYASLGGLLAKPE
jgi:hypothetical protein